MLENSMVQTHNLPIKTQDPIHNGKVRSVYWLTNEDSRRLIERHNYDTSLSAKLGVMVISDRISAFDCIWHGTDNLHGIPAKGAALNSIAYHWLSKFKEMGFAGHHIVDTPHPLIWIVQQAEPINIEAIARKYITGSMWLAYAKGEKNICGIALPDNLKKNQMLAQLLITPTTKGVFKNIQGVNATEDANISREIIEDNYKKFNFANLNDINTYEKLLISGFDFIQESLLNIGQILVDTKFEFGYVLDRNNTKQMIYIDEIGTPDSSRIWDKTSYDNGIIVENSKELFRKKLLDLVTDQDILLNSDKMLERQQLAANTEIPKDIFLEVSEQYIKIAEKITNNKLEIPKNPLQEILSILGGSAYNLLL